MDGWLPWILATLIVAFPLRNLILGAWRKPRRIDAHLHGDGSYSFQIVGEKSYQSALQAICGPPTRGGYEIEATATLILEDDNPYDDQAVAVMIDGRLVGHLSRAFAREYRARLAETGHPYALCTCPALIRGGWDRGRNDRGPFGVVLDLPRNKPNPRK